MNIDEIGYYKIADFILREPPARDECLKVVTRDADMHEFGDFSDVARRESLHRHITNDKPPAMGVLNLLVGFRFFPMPRLAITVEIGFRDAMFTGLGVHYRF